MSEAILKRQIMDWLNTQPGAYCRVIQISGIHGRKSLSKGVADILGAYKGRPLAIEVKVGANKPEPDQEEFLRLWMRRGGGISVVAYSLDDVITALRAYT